MEFSIDDLNRVIMDLSSEPLIQNPTRIPSRVATITIKQEPLSSNEGQRQQTQTLNSVEQTSSNHAKRTHLDPRHLQKSNKNSACQTFSSNFHSNLIKSNTSEEDLQCHLNLANLTRNDQSLIKSDGEIYFHFNFFLN